MENFLCLPFYPGLYKLFSVLLLWGLNKNKDKILPVCRISSIKVVANRIYYKEMCLMENKKYFWSEHEVLFDCMCMCLHLAQLSD